MDVGRLAGETGPVMGESKQASSKSGAPRVRGSLLIVGMVVLGILSGVGYYRWAAPRAQARYDAELAAAPTVSGGAASQTRFL